MSHWMHAVDPTKFRLCGDLLRPPSQEINAREEGGEFVAGALGVGGAHPMRMAEERSARAAAAAAAEAGNETAGQVALPTLTSESFVHLSHAASP